jgi:hypothetical protein
MPEPAAAQHGTTTALPPPSASGSARPPPAPSSSRVSYDPALTRRGAVDGGWWPHSRNALAELPGLIATLDSRPGIRVQRLSVHRDEWDEIPRRLTAGGRVIRVDWFTTIPRAHGQRHRSRQGTDHIAGGPARYRRRHRPDRHEHGSRQQGRRPGR